MKKIIIFILVFLFSTQNANSLIKIDITRGNLDPLPIAVSPLHIDEKSEDLKSLKEKKLGEEISKIVEKNFKSTGLFNPLKKDAFVQKPDIAHLKPRFEDWRLIKAQALVTGKILVSDNKLKVDVEYYLDHGLRSPLESLFEVFLDNPQEIFVDARNGFKKIKNKQRNIMEFLQLE